MRLQCGFVRFLMRGGILFDVTGYDDVGCDSGRGMLCGVGTDHGFKSRFGRGGCRDDVVAELEPVREKGADGQNRCVVM